jgi:hypothetical protein
MNASTVIFAPSLLNHKYNPFPSLRKQYQNFSVQSGPEKAAIWMNVA